MTIVTPELRIDPADWDRALAETDGPQLVVAGPGAGKTEFLVRRVAHLIDRGVAPESIQLLTFSRRAATDTRRRIQTRVGRGLATVGCSTFHSLALRLLETFAPERRFQLLTGPEQVDLVSGLLAEEDPRGWPPHLAGLLRSPTMAADVADFLMRSAERRLTVFDIESRDNPDWRALPALMTRYRETLDRLQRLDYALLLVETAALLDDPSVAESVAGQFRYLLVDEYQDTSPAQVAMIEPVAARHHNLTAAADPYQSIYGFRGADLAAVDQFPLRFRDAEGNPAKRMVLTTSFRVPAEILDSALTITRSSDIGLPGSAGKVTPARHRGTVETYLFDQTSAEADWIAAEIERIHLFDRVPYHRLAILLRSKRRMSAELSRALTRHRIPHDQPDSRLVDHPAVQMLFDLARLAAYDAPGPDGELDAVARRLLLGPLIALPLGLERHLVRLRRRTGRRWRDILAEAGVTEPADFVSRHEWATELPASEGLWQAWTGILAKTHDRPDLIGYPAAWTSLAQVLERLAERNPTITLIQYWRATHDDDFEATPLIGFKPASDQVSLTTLHQAKGLDFDTVFIAGADDDTFPDLRKGISLLGTHRLSPGEAPHSLRRFRLQEEMRLAYTAMCRASRRVVWTAAATTITEHGDRPSRFLRAVAGVADRASIGPPPPPDPSPTTRHQVETLLRRTLVDPAAPAAHRLAAAGVLSTHFEPGSFAGVRRRGPDRGVLGHRPTLSPTQAESYATCPRRYVLEKRLGVGERHSPYALFGSLVHEVLERSEREVLTGATRHLTWDLVEKHLGEVWEEKADFGSPLLDHAYRSKAARILVRLISEWPADALHPVRLEHPLTLELDEMTWRGRADRIDQPRPGVLRVVDHKTGSRSVSKEAAAVSLQLGFYLLAGRQDPELVADGVVEEAELWLFGSALKDFRRRFDPLRLDEVTEAMVEIGRSIRSEDWRPTPGPDCRRCSVRVVCPIWPEGAEGFIP